MKGAAAVKGTVKGKGESEEAVKGCSRGSEGGSEESEGPVKGQ